MEDLDFEEINNQCPRLDYPALGVNVDGGFWANAAADEALGRPKRVRLLFDTVRRVIAIQAADERDAKSFGLSRARRKRGFTFGGISLIKRYRLENQKHIELRPYKQGMLVGNLK